MIKTKKIPPPPLITMTLLITTLLDIFHAANSMPTSNSALSSLSTFLILSHLKDKSCKYNKFDYNLDSLVIKLAYFQKPY